jgi:hypothetical protein
MNANFSTTDLIYYLGDFLPRGTQIGGRDLKTTFGRHTTIVPRGLLLSLSRARVKGKWVYLYRAVDSSAATIDFLLSARQNAAAAERFLAKALGGANHPEPRVINTDKDAACPAAIVQLKAEGALEENCGHRPVQYLW